MSGKIQIKIHNGWTTIPNDILKNKNLSWKAKGLMCYLLSRAEEWGLHKKDIEGKSTDGYQSMLNAWKELEDAGYIETIRIKTGNLFSGYDYIVHQVPCVSSDSAVIAVSVNTKTRAPENPETINNLNIKELINKKNKIKNNSEDSSFENFWSLYPVKVAKGKSESKWNKLKKSDKEKILETLPAFIAYKPFATYTHPNPMTYLNQERWNDQRPDQSPTPVLNNATVVPTVHTAKRVVIDHSNRD